MPTRLISALSRVPRVRRSQAGGATVEENANTVWLGKQPGEAEQPQQTAEQPQTEQ